MCCGQKLPPLKANDSKMSPYRPRQSMVSDIRQDSTIEYCKHCNSIMMYVIIAGKERKQCTNPECKKIQR